MALKCDQCGAPLKPDGDEQRTECTFCGCVHEMKAPQPAPREPSESETYQPSLLGAILGVVGFLVLFVGLASFTIFAADCTDSKPVLSHQVRTALEMTQFRDGQGTWRTPTGTVTISGSGSDLRIRFKKGQPPRRPSRPAKERFLWTAHGTCVVDADGDSIDDVASTTSGVGTSYHLTIASGKDGRFLWRGKGLPGYPQFYCLSKRWFAVALPGFRLRLHNVRRPTAPVTIQLRDKLSRFAMGRDCVSLEAADETVVSFALPSGKKTRCRTPRRRTRHAHTYTGLILQSERRRTLKQGDTVYEVSIRRRGTPMLTVQARRQNRRLWSRALPYAATRSGAGLALHSNTLVVYGATTDRDAIGVLLGLDPTTGKDRYKKRLKNGGDSPSFFHHNGRFLLLAWTGGLYAHDPASGKLRWKVAR